MALAMAPLLRFSLRTSGIALAFASFAPKSGRLSGLGVECLGLLVTFRLLGELNLVLALRESEASESGCPSCGGEF